MDQAPTAHRNNTHSLTTIKTMKRLADKHSEEFLHEVLYPRGIKVKINSLHRDMLKSLQGDLGSNQLAFKKLSAMHL